MVGCRVIRAEPPRSGGEGRGHGIPVQPPQFMLRRFATRNANRRGSPVIPVAAKRRAGTPERRHQRGERSGPAYRKPLAFMGFVAFGAALRVRLLAPLGPGMTNADSGSHRLDAHVDVAARGMRIGADLLMGLTGQ